MKGISTILVDDERVGRSRLRRLLEKEPDIEILSECGDGTAAFETMREHVPDLLFLDINMPGMDGFGVLEALGPERQPRAVIFVTAYDEHAVRAFEACALDYVLKPVSPDRLAKALTRVRERLRTATRRTCNELRTTFRARAGSPSRRPVHSLH
jgi:two-component system, LytTR family, response regulator